MKELWKRVRPDDTVKIALTRKELDAVEEARGKNRGKFSYISGKSKFFFFHNFL